jgi:hypothetical protein
VLVDTKRKAVGSGQIFTRPERRTIHPAIRTIVQARAGFRSVSPKTLSNMQ